MSIVIEMTPTDFMQLWNTATEGGDIWRDQIKEGRFEDHEHNRPMGTWWKHLYWLGENWVNVILARAWLNNVGQGYAITFDTYSNEWVIATHYDWRDDDAKSEAGKH